MVVFRLYRDENAPTCDADGLDVHQNTWGASLPWLHLNFYPGKVVSVLLAVFLSSLFIEERSGGRSRRCSSGSAELLRDPSTGQFLSKAAFVSDSESDAEDSNDEDEFSLNNPTVVVDSDDQESSESGKISKFIFSSLSLLYFLICACVFF